MMYCNNCGAPLGETDKFCTQCGQQVQAVAEETAAQPEGYAAGEERAWEKPQTYEVPTRSYARNVYQQEDYPKTGKPGYTMGAATGEKPRKKTGLVIGILIAVVLVAALAVVLMLGGKDKDPNLGKYEAVSCEVVGFAADYEGDWIELKDGGKANLMLMGEPYYCAWKLEGETLTVTQQGDEFVGTLKNGEIVLDFGGMVYNYRGENYTGTGEIPAPEVPVTEAPAAEAPATEAPVVKEGVGRWTLVKVESDDPELVMDEETVQIGRDLGLEMYLELLEDGTGALVMIEERIEFQWEGNTIWAEDYQDKLEFEINGQELFMNVDGALMYFTASAAAAPSVDSTSYGANWEGDWYGWWVVWEGAGDWTELVDSYWDTYARVSLTDGDHGVITLWDMDGSYQEYMAEVNVKFVSGTSDFGAMVSQNGTFYGDEIDPAQWYVDPAADFLSEYEKMIVIEGTYTDPANAANTMDYMIFLRPWGMRWEDVRTGDNSENPYDDMMPAAYDDWYLPLLEKGLTQAPNSFEAGKALLD